MTGCGDLDSLDSINDSENSSSSKDDLFGDSSSKEPANVSPPEKPSGETIRIAEPISQPDFTIDANSLLIQEFHTFAQMDFSYDEPSQSGEYHVYNYTIETDDRDSVITAYQKYIDTLAEQPNLNHTENYFTQCHS